MAMPKTGCPYSSPRMVCPATPWNLTGLRLGSSRDMEHRVIRLPLLALLSALAFAGCPSAGGDEAADECKDPRQFGDGKNGDDKCWSPPDHYCAQGADNALTTACDADGQICCDYPTTCIPCGFVNCDGCLEGNAAERCPEACAAAHSSDLKACRMPDKELVICQDK
jgi:hypothetical protein